MLAGAAAVVTRVLTEMMRRDAERDRLVDRGRGRPGGHHAGRRIPSPPMAAIAIGAIAALTSYTAMELLARTRLDDRLLDVFACHGVGVVGWSRPGCSRPGRSIPPGPMVSPGRQPGSASRCRRSGSRRCGICRSGHGGDPRRLARSHRPPRLVAGRQPRDRLRREHAQRPTRWTPTRARRISPDSCASARSWTAQPSRPAAITGGRHAQRGPTPSCRQRSQSNVAAGRSAPLARPSSRERLLFDSTPSRRREAIDLTALPRGDGRSGCASTTHGWRRAYGPWRLSLRRLRSSIARSPTKSFAGSSSRTSSSSSARSSELRHPRLEDFAELIAIYERTQSNRGGRVADYIPQLGRVAPELYGVSLCTIDGQRLSIGDAGVPFCVQSSSKPVVYCIALEDRGEEIVHRHMARAQRAELQRADVEQGRRPHNPMINAGAIDERLVDQARPVDGRPLRLRTSTCGPPCRRPRPGFSNPVYLSNGAPPTATSRSAYFMRGRTERSPGIDLVETPEFYFQCCSLEVTTDTMAVVAATLGQRRRSSADRRAGLPARLRQKCLSLMYCAGCTISPGSGVPHRTSGQERRLGRDHGRRAERHGRSHRFSPRLDSLGNSVRGIDFCREMIGRFNFHNYDNLVGGVHGKKDPRLVRRPRRRNLLVDLCWASSEGDLTGIRRLIVEGVNLDEAGLRRSHRAASGRFRGSGSGGRVLRRPRGRAGARGSLGATLRSTTRGGPGTRTSSGCSSRRSLPAPLLLSQPGDGGSYGTGFHLGHHDPRTVTTLLVNIGDGEKATNQQCRAPDGTQLWHRPGPLRDPRRLGARAAWGEVCRARDTPRLGRDVAVKILPAHLSRRVPRGMFPSGRRFSPRRAGSRSHQSRPLSRQRQRPAISGLQRCTPRFDSTAIARRHRIQAQAPSPGISHGPKSHRTPEGPAAA